MIELPEEYKLGLQKLSVLPDTGMALRGHETERARVGFINRKKDRFTFSIRFHYANETTKGKKYSKWQTLNALSATLKDGRLNLFIMGHLQKAIYFNKVVNITRQPYLIYKALGTNPELISFIQNEFKALYARNGLDFPFSSDPTLLSTELLKASYPAWKFIAPSEEENFNRYLNYTQSAVPELFSTDALRESTFDAFLERITSKSEFKLQELIKSNPKALALQIRLFALMASRKMLSEEKRIEIFNQEWKASNSVKITADNLAQARSLLKNFTVEERFSILMSSSNTTALTGSIEEWSNSKYLLREKKIALRFADKPTPNWLNVYSALQEARKLCYETDAEKSETYIKEFLDSILVSKYLSKEKYGEKEVRTSINYRYNSLHGLPYSSTKRKTTISFNIALPQKSFARTSTLFSMIKDNNLHQGRQNNEGMEFSSEEYASILKLIEKEAKDKFKLYGIEITPENIALYVTALIAISFSPKLVRYKGIVPQKWFKLAKAGLSPYATLLFLEKRISNKTALDYVDIPDSWIARSIGIPFTEDDDSSFF